MRVKAFNLLEVMVVIAIIGILSAAAAPAYNNYIYRSRMSTIIPLLTDIMHRSISYGDANKRFGNAYDLGLSATPGSWTVDDPVSIHPYFGGAAPTSSIRSQYPTLGPTGRLSVYDASTGYADCGMFGIVVSEIDPALVGFPSSLVDSPTNLFAFCYYWHTSGIVHSACFYGYGTATVSQTKELLPGWHNINLTSNWDNNNGGSGPYAGGDPTWPNMTCQ